jgi:hypothetical protein
VRSSVTSALADVIAIHAGHVYAMEIKTEGGRVSAAQVATLSAMEKAGATVTIAKGSMNHSRRWKRGDYCEVARRCRACGCALILVKTAAHMRS